MMALAALLILTWLYPLVLAVVYMVRPRTSPWLAVSAAGPALVAALATPKGAALELSWVLLGARYGMDEVAQTFLFFTAALWLLAAIFGVGYLAKDNKRWRYSIYFLLAMAGNLGLIVAQDMGSFYTWYALMSFASYGLVVHTGDEEARTAARVYIILVMIGEVLLFAGLAMLFIASNSLALDPVADPLAAALIFASFGVKAGVVLLHVWLPLAHPAAPIPASAVLSGAMIKAGVLGWLRFLNPVGALGEWGGFLIGVGLVTAFYGALIGVTQRNAKTVLAYSSISQIGLITVACGAWLLTGRTDQAALTAVLLYVMHHGLAKGALFLGVGFAGVNRAATAALLLPALALAGFPLTSGAVAKAALKAATATLPDGWPALLNGLLPLAAVGTTLLMARFLWLMASTAPQTKRPPKVMWGAWLALLVGVAGVLFVWPSAGSAVRDAFKPDSLWVATWPVLVGALAAAMAPWVVRSISWSPLPAGDALVLYASIVVHLSQALRVAQNSVEGGERRLVAAFSAWRRRIAAADLAASWELRLRSNWLLVGGALLGLTLALLWMVGAAIG